MIQFKASKLTLVGAMAMLFFAFIFEACLVSEVVEQPNRDNVILLVLGTLFFGGIWALFGISLIYSYFHTTKHLRLGLQKYGEENLNKKIQNHCISVYKHPITGNAVYFTDELIIAPKETIIDYNDICMMYKKVVNSNRIRHVYLHFALKDGAEYSLCDGIEDAMIHNYMQLSFQHNAGIMFGYTKENQEKYKNIIKENKRKQ